MLMHASALTKHCKYCVNKGVRPCGLLCISVYQVAFSTLIKTNCSFCTFFLIFDRYRYNTVNSSIHDNSAVKV